jgi:hypothetical protein
MRWLAVRSPRSRDLVLVLCGIYAAAVVSAILVFFWIFSG